MGQTFVAILMGSISDSSKVEGAISILKKLNVSYQVRVHSAHRTPVETQEYVKKADKDGCGVFICCAGMAAHLAGAVAALTIKPVIGVPIDSGPLDGLDALLSTVQMPGGIPVATVAIGTAGVKNAAYLACQMLALSDSNLRERLIVDRQENAEKVLDSNKELQSKLNC